MNVLDRTLTRIILCVSSLCLSGFLIDLDHLWGGRPMHYLIRDSPACWLLYCLLYGLITYSFTNGWSGLK